MPLPPLGHTLLTQPWAFEGGVFIPDLASRMHELPPPNVEIQVLGEGADSVVEFLKSRGRRAVVSTSVLSEVPAPARPAWRLWRAADWVEERSIRPGSRVLDFGCGSGRDAVALAAKGHDVTGFDVLPDALLRARDLESRYGDGPPVTWTQFPRDALFDLVLLLRCGRRELPETAFKHVAPGGSLWFTGKTDVFADLSSHHPIHLEPGPVWTRAEFMG